MEAVIARLLNDFESGKMTRRQLVQSLALMAVGLPVASAIAESSAKVASAPPTPAPWKTVWLDHISFQVADYKKSVDFYTDLMGWKVVSEQAGRQATLDINGIGGIIIRNGRGGRGAPTAAPAPAQQADTAARRTAPITGVIDHISWGVEPWDTDGVKAELEKRGLQPRADMVGANFKSWHVKDPDGWDLQISNQTKEKHDV